MVDPKPSGKTALTTGAGALGIIAVWVITMFGADVPPEVAAAISTLLAALVAYLVPAKSGTFVEDPDADWGAEQGSMADFADEEAV